MKKIFVLAIACLMIFAGVGCSQQVKEVNVSVSDIIEDIQAKMVEDLKEAGLPEDSFKNQELPGYMKTDLTSEEGMQGPMTEVFNKEDIEEGIVIQHMMSLNADLMIVLKAKDETSVNNLQESLNKIKEQQDMLWSQYLPDQYEKVKNTIIKVEGNYLVYITYSNPESIETIFDNAFNQ